MKPEKEFVILLKLLDSPFKNKGFFKKKSATKIELEKYLKISEKNKDFRNWLNRLIKEGCIVNVGDESRGSGKIYDVFAVDESLMVKRLKENSIYKEVAYPFFTNRAFFNAIFD